MKTTIVKGTIGVLSASGLGVGSYYGYQALNNKTEIQKSTESLSLANKLKKESYIPIDINTNSSHIEAILSNYKSASSIPPEFKFADFNGDAIGNKPAKDILLEKCNVILNNEHVSEQDQKKAKKWCVEPTNVVSLLKAKGINSLNLDTRTTTDKATWGEKIKQYRSSSENRIDTLTFTSTTEAPTDPEINQIKEKCKNIGDTKNHEDRFETTLDLFEIWCSNK